MILIEFNHVRKEFENFVALHDVNLKIHKGELFTLIGPSGCGKTTTLRMINRLTEPTSGQILIDGQDISNFDPVMLRRNIGYIIQEIGLFPHMTIEQNISLVPRLKKEDPEKYLKRVDELLELVGLDPDTYKQRTPSELSGGQQQRVGVIRALAADPDIILMDEPFSALDPISREQLQKDIRQLQTEIKKTIVFVTHDMDEALALGDRVCLMREGEIVQVDRPQQLILHPATPFAKKFIGGKKSLWHTAIDVIADRSMSRTMTEQEYANQPDQQEGWHVIIAEDHHYVGAVVNGERVELQTLPNDMKLYEATEHLQSSQQIDFPVLAGDRLVGILNYENIVAYFKDSVSIENGVIQT